MRYTIQIGRLSPLRFLLISLLLAATGSCGLTPPGSRTANIVVPVLTSAAASNQNPIPVTIEWTYAVSDFTGTEMVIDNGTMQNFSGTGTTYSFEIVPTAEGDVTIYFPPGAASDSSDSASTYAALVIRYDLTPPTVVLTRNGALNQGTLPVQFTATFDEAIDPTTFTSADLTQLGSAANLTWSVTDQGDHIHFTVNLTAVAGGWGTVLPRIAAGIVNDVAGNGCLVSTSGDTGVVYLPPYSAFTVWYKADALSLAHGDPVTSWTDSGPNANHAVEAVNPPTFWTNQQNALPVVHFAGGNEILRTNSNSGVTGNPDMTIFVVTRVNNFGVNYPPFIQIGEGSTTGLSAWMALTGFSDQLYTGFYDGGDGSVLSVNPGFNVYTWVRDSGGGSNDTHTGNSQYWNGIVRATGPFLSTHAVTMVDGRIRLGRGTVNTSIEADIAEIIVVNGTALDPSNRAKMEHYLNSKWNLY